MTSRNTSTTVTVNTGIFDTKPRTLFATALLGVALAISTPLVAQDTPVQELSRADNSLEIDRYQQAIDDLEHGEGAYSPQLPERLLSLGMSLQYADRHADAISIFKRGVHLARINGGLYSAEQIPLLQSEIRSHMALGEFTAADERQVYLYRVQLRTLASGRQRAMALIQQANWQQRAYELGVGEHSFQRLMNMWDLYRLALNDIIERDGETDPSLLPPLYGMLRTQYLISDYQGESSSGFNNDSDFAARQGQNRFNAYRSQSYQKGLAIIHAIYDVEQTAPEADERTTANNLVMLGDWTLWHGEREEAFTAYHSALGELAGRDDAQALTQHLFSEPVALPNMDGVETLPAVVAPEAGNILLDFGVTERGRVVDLERLDDNEGNTGKANRLMRQLRRTQFRPRFEEGEPVATQHVTWAYDSTQW